VYTVAAAAFTSRLPLATAGFVDNFGTLYAVNPKVQSVYQEFIGHVTFYTSSSCVWM